MQSKACLAAIRARTNLTQTIKTIKKAKHGGAGAIYYRKASDSSIAIKKRAVEYKSGARCPPDHTAVAALGFHSSCGQKKPNRAIHQSGQPRRFARRGLRPAVLIYARASENGPKTSGAMCQLLSGSKKHHRY